MYRTETEIYMNKNTFSLLYYYYYICILLHIIFYIIFLFMPILASSDCKNYL